MSYEAGDVALRWSEMRWSKMRLKGRKTQPDPKWRRRGRSAGERKVDRSLRSKPSAGDSNRIPSQNSRRIEPAVKW